MEIESFRVGGIECKVFVHGKGRGAPHWMFPDIPSEPRSQRMGPYLNEQGEFEFAYSSLLVKSGAEIALLDTSHPIAPGARRSSTDQALADSGLAPSDVDVVVVSHGHLDHVGALTTNGHPSYHRARHYIHEEELLFWTSGDQADGATAAQLRPVVEAGLVQTVEGEREVLPGVRLLPTPGHTPGHLSVVIRSGRDRALYVGDALAHEVNVGEPDWNHFSDMSGDAAARSRRQLVARAAREGAMIVGSHMTTRGRAVVDQEGQVTYVPA